MSEMVEMVIKIPKDTLDVVNSFGLWRTQRFIQETVSRALAHGVVLPKGHGRLIDADALIDSLSCSDRDIYCKAVIEEDAPTII